MKIGVSSMMVEVGSSFSENRKYFDIMIKFEIRQN
jgi:hypothetical protein